MTARPEDLDEDGNYNAKYMARYNAAREEFERALKAFSEVVDPGEYVMHWAVVLHKTSVALEQSDMSAVGIHFDADITFVEKRGLIEIMRDKVLFRD